MDSSDRSSGPCGGRRCAPGRRAVRALSTDPATAGRAGPGRPGAPAPQQRRPPQRKLLIPLRTRPIARRHQPQCTPALRSQLPPTARRPAQYTQPTAAYPQYPQSAGQYPQTPSQQYPATYGAYPYVAQQPTPETMPAPKQTNNDTPQPSQNNMMPAPAGGMPMANGAAQSGACGCNAANYGAGDYYTTPGCWLPSYRRLSELRRQQPLRRYRLQPEPMVRRRLRPRDDSHELHARKAHR